MGRTKRAVLAAEAVSVNCPDCGEPQPSPDNGSDMWTPGNIRERNGSRLTCVSCDAGFVLDPGTRVALVLQ